jgi:hypothetical protein
MGFLFMLLFVPFHLISTGLDIVIFFLIVRIVLFWRSIKWLKRFNKAGRTLVDAIAQQTDRLWYKATRKQLSERGKIIVSLAVWSFVRLLLSEVVKFF